MGSAMGDHVQGAWILPLVHPLSAALHSTAPHTVERDRAPKMWRGGYRCAVSALGRGEVPAPRFRLLVCPFSSALHTRYRPGHCLDLHAGCM